MRQKKYCRSEWNKIHGCQQNEQRHKGETMRCEGICQLLTVSSVNITVSVKITFGGCKSCTSTQIIKKNALYSEKFYTAGIHFTWPLVATVMTNLNSECLVLFCFFSACSAKYSMPNVLFGGKNKITACHSRENSLVSQETKLPRTKSRRGSLYCSSTRQLVYVPQQGTVCPQVWLLHCLLFLHVHFRYDWIWEK